MTEFNISFTTRHHRRLFRTKKVPCRKTKPCKTLRHGLCHRLYFNFMEKTVKIKWDLDYGLSLETKSLSTSDKDLFLNILHKEILFLENQ